MWLLGSLPFLGRDPSKCHLNCAEENNFYVFQKQFRRNSWSACRTDSRKCVEHEILAPPPFDHNLTQFPKLSTFSICNRARLYSKRTKSRRVVNEDLDLAEPDAFGQQLACDHLIVFKSSIGKEHAVLIVQDRFSKVLQAYPTISREASHLASNLKHFVGLRPNSLSFFVLTLPEKS